MLIIKLVIGTATYYNQLLRLKNIAYLLVVGSLLVYINSVQLIRLVLRDN